jgi:hypothetical protein
MINTDLKPHLNLIKEALTKVEPGYFKIQTTCEPSGIVRERAFCYELYHQIRLNQGKNPKLTLNGEIDKRNHRDFEKGDRKNPDFVFHIPGTHSCNTIVMEVKGIITYSDEKIKKDFTTLHKFVTKYQYIAGVFVIYNHSLEEFKGRCLQTISEFKAITDSKRVVILAIKKANGKPEEKLLSEL